MQKIKLTPAEISQLKELLNRLNDQIGSDVASNDERTSAAAWNALTGTIEAKMSYVETTTAS